MNIYSYGKIYSRLSKDQINSLRLGVSLGKTTALLAKIYFSLFGYPDVASQRRFVIVDKLLNLKKGERILDAGCGNGIYLQEFMKRHATIGVGIDARKERINDAIHINNYLAGNNTFITSTLERVNLGKTRFDKAICLEVLEHIKNDGLVLSRLSRSLKRNGLFIVSVPVKGTALSLEQEIDPNFKPKKYEHVRSGYDLSDLKVMVKKAGLKVVSIQEYFFYISRYTVKIQQYLYVRNMVLLNLLVSPFLTLVSTLDNIFKFGPRGYILILRKK